MILFGVLSQYLPIQKLLNIMEVSTIFIFHDNIFNRNP